MRCMLRQPKAKAKPKPTPVAVTAGDPRKERLCWNFRDYGSCSKGKDCPFSHDKDLRKKALESKGKGKSGQSGGQESYPAKGQGKSKGKGKGRQGFACTGAAAEAEGKERSAVSVLR